MSWEQSTDSPLRWCKSSYSGSDGGDCVEVATDSGMVLVRDSKLADGARLRIPADGWTAFVFHAAQSEGC